MDQPVTVLPASTVAPSVAQEIVGFDPPRTLRYHTSEHVAGSLDNRLGAILDTLTGDGEIILQLTLSTSPLAPDLAPKVSRGATHFLRITIYGPKKMFSKLGEFVNKCGCYLEDPVDCDRNVPYMNPQLLSSIYENLPMTFDLPRLQPQNIGNFVRAPVDVLAGFETTISIDQSTDPTALSTSLKPYVS